MSAVRAEPDACAARFAAQAAGLLRTFNDAGVLVAADVHVATRLAELAGEREEPVRLAAALAVRAPRLGHVHVDLRRIRETAAVEGEEAVEIGALPWPEPEAWIAAVAASELVAVGDGTAERRPLRLLGSRLYLDRYWAEERQVAEDLLAMGSRSRESGVDGPELARLFGAGEMAEGPRAAAANALTRGLSVLAGGPGTGKTTTVARIVALVLIEAAARGRRAPLIALAAPTGKAKARLEEAVHAEARALDVPDGVRAAMLALEATTLHRLLGRRRDSDSRFRHDRRQHLPHDLIVVDETSMVSLSMMARLLEAVRPAAHLVLVGDPAQLASIEAGAVLGDIVAPLRAGPLADGIVVLEHGHRFGGRIAGLADAVRRGDADAALAVLDAGGDDVRWLDVDAGAGDPSALAGLRETAGEAAASVLAAARAHDASGALRALSAFRLLCAHRRGPYGVATWSARVEGWLGAAIAGFDPEDPWYVGRALLVVENDYELDLYNGDTGVIVGRGDGSASAVFERRGEVLEYSPSRLGAVETVLAMTIHKSQGSQFDTAAVLLPPPDSRLLSRELLYTALTRGRRRVIVVGTEAAIRAAVARPVQRASGLRERLWP